MRPDELAGAATGRPPPAAGQSHAPAPTAALDVGCAESEAASSRDLEVEHQDTSLDCAATPI
eukprot:6479684-Alexandrium_andersonii.AAC.1